MKKAFYLFIGCLCCGLASAQPVVKGHVWKQQAARGLKPSANADARSAATTGTFYIFLEYKKAQNIVPYRVWIDGKPFRVANEIKPGGPVVIQRPSIDTGTESDTLVALTSNQVVQVNAIAPVAKLTLPAPEAALKDAQQGKVVVEYYWKAKRYAYTLPEIKMLPTVRLQ